MSSPLDEYLPNHRRFILNSWEELIGELETLEIADGEFIVQLSTGSLAYPIGSERATYLEEELTGHEGSRVSILRTDLKDQPILLTILDDP